MSAARRRLGKARRWGGLAAALLAATLVLAPPADAAKQRTTFPLHYVVASSPSATETVFERSGLRLTASCAGGGDGAKMEAVSTGDAGTLVESRTEPGGTSFFAGELDENPRGLVFDPENLTGQFVFRSSTGVVITATYGAENGDAFNESACVIAGTVTVAKRNSPNRVRSLQDANTTAKVIDRGGAELRVFCGAAEGALFARNEQGQAAIHVASESSEGVMEKGLFPPPRTPRLGGSLLTYDHLPLLRLADVVYSNSRGSVMSASMSLLDEAAHCDVAGTARSVGEGSGARALYAQNLAGGSTHRKFYDAGGLKLFGECGAGSTRIYAQSADEDAAIYYRVHSDGQPDLAVGFDETGAGPTFEKFLLDTPDRRSGDFVYARPGGRVTTFQWSSSNGLGYKDCLFAAIASSASA